jgi:aminoglycoside/choline kinase family phosphotransferase
MGPRLYDLVSLLNDSYVTHDAAFVSEMKSAFFEGSRGDPGGIESEYDLAALQRNLKALGTFGFQIAARGNDVYLRYVAPTLALVRDNLERNRRWDRLGRTLARHLPELG